MFDHYMAEPNVGDFAGYAGAAAAPIVAAAAAVAADDGVGTADVSHDSMLD